MPNAVFSTKLHYDSVGARLQCSGELDVATAAILDAALDEALREPTPILHVDLIGTTFFASVGGDLLFDLLARCGASGVRLRVSGSDAVRRVLNLLGFPEGNMSLVRLRHRTAVGPRLRPRPRRLGGGVALAAGRHRRC